jgi:ureidoacrylate peracid hydrolase
MSMPSSSLRQSIQAGISKRTDFPLVDFPLVPSKLALLIIDVQKYCCGKNDGDYYTTKALPQMVSNIEILLDTFRRQRDEGYDNDSADSHQIKQPPNSTGCEVIFVIIQSKTKDGRDLSIDYKLSGPYFASTPKANETDDDIFLPTIKPTMEGRGDIVVSKTSCSVFNSTNIDYILRNLFVEQLVVCGQLTDQCVESAVRDAADLGYLVSVVTDACATHSEDRHQKGLLGMNGFCRQVTTYNIVQEFHNKASTMNENGDGNHESPNKKRKTDDDE